jgi:hypothetical protein
MGETSNNQHPTSNEARAVNALDVGFWMFSKELF